MGQKFVESQPLSAQRHAIFSVISVRSVVNLFLSLLLMLAWLGMAPEGLGVKAQGLVPLQAAQVQPAAPEVIKSESNVVLVEVIVTDKKGRYLRDLNQKEFHVFEDGAEQPITSFSREADNQPGAPERQRYMVLFFDNEGLGSADQMPERDAAVKFVEGMVSPQGAQGVVPPQSPMVAVLDFDRGLQVAQNFTVERDLLISAIRKTNYSPSQVIGVIPPGQEVVNATAHLAGGLLLALRSVAGTLATVPGRKTLLFFSAGFGLTSARPYDFQNTVDALNLANVGVYTLSAGAMQTTGSYASGNPPHRPGVPYSTFNEQVSAMEPNAAGGGAPTDPSKLALQTGGFPIAKTNDLASAMERVSAEMHEYYLLGYVPRSAVHDGRYHQIRVKVDRAGVEVRARSGYADTKSPDLLAGKAEGVALEAKATSTEAGQIPVTLRTPYFYVRPGVARVNLALSIPGSAVNFEQHNDDFQSQINVLGIAYRDDGSVAARFSDTVNLNYGKDKLEEVRKTSIDYQNFILIAPGDYMLKVVLGAGGADFGKYVKPLVVDPFTGKQLTLSGPAFGDQAIASLLSSSDIDQKNIEGSVPMVAGGAQLVPSSSNHFKQGAQPEVYVEVYEPLLEGNNPQMGILFNIVNAKTNQKGFSSNTLPINGFAHPGNPLVPAIFRLPIDKLPAGDYTLQIWARDSAGNVSESRTGDFSIN
jgi:VWFA-related protein